jgi:hypothetical protein
MRGDGAAAGLPILERNVVSQVRFPRLVDPIAEDFKRYVEDKRLSVFACLGVYTVFSMDGINEARRSHSTRLNIARHGMHACSYVSQRASGNTGSHEFVGVNIDRHLTDIQRSYIMIH